MPPPRRSYATPEETFGIAKKPLNDWFDFAASGLERTGPAFSADLEDADFRNQQRELEREKLRQQMDSEQAASAFMKRAAGQSPTGLMQMIADDPAILSSSGYGNIQDYVNMRSQLEQQKQVEQPFSNKTLAPALMKSMKPADQLRFQKYLGEGLDTVTAFDRMEQEDATRARQEKYRASSLGLIEEGADPVAVDAAIASPDPDRAFALIKRDLRKATGKTGSGELSLADIIKLKKENINDYGEVIDADVATYLDTQLKQAIAPKKTINPSTGAVISQGDFDAAAEQARLDAARKEDEAVRDVAPPPPPSTFIPATAEEERQLAAQQQRAVAESQKQQLADVAWTGVKGTAAAQGADAGSPADIVAEARRAIVGGETTSKRAQRIAALARASVEGRDVNVGTRKVVRIDPGSGVPFDDTESDMVSPAEALVRELGFKPDAIVGQAPSRAGGPLRDVTALQAAQAILADAADPYIKLTQGQQAQAKASQMSDKVAKGLESISGTGNTQK
jgi:hypothetical protein